MAIGSTISASWQIDPACDVIETGLLLGNDVTTLSPAGEPIYAYREGYTDEIPTRDSGVYWVAAYAVDEGGTLIQSRPRFVSVVVPPVLGPESSDDALPSLTGPVSADPDPPYDGTDADFLKPAGNPHFASLRALDFNSGLTRQSVFFRRILETHAATRVIASTHRDEVAAQQSRALPFGFSPNVADVASALNLLDQRFVQVFPRPGLYAVSCSADEFSGVVSNCRAPLFGFNPGDLGLSLGVQDESVTDTGAGITLLNTGFARSSATFFIPASPAGQRVQTARLTAFFLTESTPEGAAAPQLNGRPPVAVVNRNCAGFDGLIQCSGTLTWDFTDEARALSAQGGGLLKIVPTPPPQGIVDVLFGGDEQVTRESLMMVSLAANFPWRHGAASSDTLTITFEAACPQELTLSVSPRVVRPRLPNNTPLRGELANFPTQATVQTVVKTCPPQGGGVGSVQVNLKVDETEPIAGTAEAGGHFHDTRPTRARGTLSASSCVAIIDASGIGSCPPVTYRPSEVSSIETIKASVPSASAARFSDAQAKVTVEVDDLTNLSDVITNFFRLTGSTGTHPDNHWATSTTATNIQLVALDFFDLFQATLGINDMSLTIGGLFDYQSTWAPPHDAHRTGTSVDIDRSACFDPFLRRSCSPLPVDRNQIGKLCQLRGRGYLAPEKRTPPPIHCEFPN